MLTDTIEPPNDDAMESDDEPRHQLRPPINPMPNSRSDAIPSTLIPRGEEGETGEVGEVGGRLNLADGSLPRLSSAGTDPTQEPQQNVNPSIRQNRSDQPMQALQQSSDELAIEHAAKQAMNTLALTKNPVEYLADKIHVLSHWFKKSCSIEFRDEICGVTNFEKWLRALVAVAKNTADAKPRAMILHRPRVCYQRKLVRQRQTDEDEGRERERGGGREGERERGREGERE